VGVIVDAVNKPVWGRIWARKHGILGSKKPGPGTAR